MPPVNRDKHIATTTFASLRALCRTSGIAVLLRTTSPHNPCPLQPASQLPQQGMILHLQRPILSLWPLIRVSAACLPSQTPTYSSSTSSESEDPLYATHVPLGPLQKASVALVSAVGALVRPQRADLVATVGETWGEAAFSAMRDRMRADPVGRRVLQERPIVTSASVSGCWDMPPGTFGRAYADFMGARGFEADDRPPVRFIDDEELAYVVTRAREVHDFWHVLFGCHTNVFGELALKAVEFVQTGLPMTAMAVAGGQLKLSPADRQLLWSTYLPWAARTGVRCADLMCIYYEDHFQEDLEDLRRRWRIVPAPPPPHHLAPKERSAAAQGASGTGSQVQRQ